ncbi:aldolase/citrate lyase family protein [uncultured Algimonas sp.]|uniref:HpcH/HpaI aldolase/citrate lyase family protein n=1 Tax=uncultured Algimonas sp. TaxID=1547920 RepID=UPI0026091C27|nr:aldolase/citrate lyase family protein [uncultured Algimonas sp.]
MLEHRSLLLVPGNRPESFAEACASGSDLVCLDLEGAVPAADKPAARDAVTGFLRSTDHAHVGLRINGPASGFFADDDEAAAALDVPFVMVPKIDRAGQLDAVTADAPLMPVIESARAVLAAEAIMARGDVAMALFGGGDYTADMAIPMAFESLLHVRSHLAICAVAHGVRLFDVPYLDAGDVAGGEADTARVAALGIRARAAIDAGQIPAIHAALDRIGGPVDQAERLRAAYAQER